MKLTDVAVRRPVFTTMMMGALLVLGLFSLSGLPVEMMPQVDFPFTTIVTLYPGASAETIETQVSKPIEDKVNEIEGVRNITSISREGYSLVFIEFQLEKNSFEATNQTREKVAAVRGDLPEDIDEPVVSSYDPASQAIMYMTVSGKRSPREITELVKNTIKKRLETVPGVGNVAIIGGAEREILASLNPRQMESYGVTVNDVSNAIAAANMEIPGGRVNEAQREYLVRIMGRLDRVEEFNNIIVKSHKGVPVYLRDIATVADTVEEQRSLSRYNGEPAVSVALSRQSGANVVEMADAARQVIEDLKAELPKDIEVNIVVDDSKFIKDSVHEIQVNIMFGMLLAIIVIFLFLLDLRPTIITGLSIPISLVATFTLMKMLDFTVNTMTLLGLSLTVGILVDDAIVVIENIYRHIAKGESPFDAALKATKEIGLAVMATTFSIVVVFIPVAFMEGLIGRFFFQFGMTVAFAVIISLFVAFTLTPMLSSRWLQEHVSSVKDYARKKNVFVSLWQAVRSVLNYWNVVFDWLKPKYESLLAASLRHRWVVILVAAVSFFASIYLARFVGQEFMAQTDEGKVYVDITTPPGTDLATTSLRIAEVESIVTKRPEVKSAFVTIGEGDDPVTNGRVMFTLVDKAERAVTAKQMMDTLRNLLSDVTGAKLAVSKGHSEGGGDKEVEISIRGEDMAQLTHLMHQVQSIFYHTQGTTDVDNTQEEGKPELQITVDRKLAEDLGLNLAAIPLTVRALVEGDVVTRFKEGMEEYDVRMRLDESFRASADEVGRLLVASNKDIPGQDVFLVPVGRVAQIEKAASVGRYTRFNRQREVRVNANVLSGYFGGTVSGEIMTQVAELDVPPGYYVGPVGTSQLMTESFQNILKALLLSVIFVYLLLASQYESFTDPFSIMLSLPLSLVGAILALLISGSSFSVISLIGIVLLMGLVTKNAILLIDFVKQQRQAGLSRTEAILQAGPIRLRPILMTTFAMVFGMLPLALGLGPGAEIRAPMAQAVIGGIISSTLLTLVVVPVVYSVIDDMAGLFRRRKTTPQTAQRQGITVREQTDSPH